MKKTIMIMCGVFVAVLVSALCGYYIGFSRALNTCSNTIDVAQRETDLLSDEVRVLASENDRMKDELNNIGVNLCRMYHGEDYEVEWTYDGKIYKYKKTHGLFGGHAEKSNYSITLTNME